MSNVCILSDFYILLPAICPPAICQTSRSRRWRWTAWSRSTSLWTTRTWSVRRARSATASPATRRRRCGAAGPHPWPRTRRWACHRPPTRSWCGVACSWQTLHSCTSRRAEHIPPSARDARNSPCQYNSTSDRFPRSQQHPATVLFEPFIYIFLWVNKNDWIVFIDRVFCEFMLGRSPAPPKTDRGR